MNILFLLRGTKIGGLEVVTSIIANKFVSEGHSVGVFIFKKNDDGYPITDKLDRKVKIFQHNHYACDRNSTKALLNAVKIIRPQVIINQWGLPLIPIKTAKKVISHFNNIKIVSVYHNAPNANGRIQKIKIKLLKTENPLKRFFLRLKESIFTIVTSKAMCYNYNKSDCFLVLSESYISVFKDFTHIKDANKLSVMTNPITIPPKDLESIQNRISNIGRKEKEIIFVGRLDFVQKRTYRVIDVWNLLEDKYQDWKLTLVGEGPDRDNLERHVKALNLKRVNFAGFQDPLAYYKRASVLILTSDYEGFPLVLAEAMSFGVVPVVYNSFKAAKDIIDSGTNGILVDKTENNFNAETMANGIETVIKSIKNQDNMQIAAIRKSEKYSLNSIYNRWLNLFNNLGIQ